MGNGAILSQNHHPIAYLNKPLSLRNKSVSTYEKEMLAILFAVEKLRPYLVGSHFKIITDHQTFRHLHDQHITTPAQHKWLAKLLGNNFTFEYRVGSLNKLLTLYLVSPKMFLFLQALYTSDPNTIAILHAISTNTMLPAGFSFQNKLFLYRNRIFVPHM